MNSEETDRDGFEALQLAGPIAFQRVFVTWTGGSINAALMLSQLVFWTRMTYWGKWIYKTGDEWYEELGLSRKQQMLAREKLRDLGLVEEKRTGIPAKLYFRLHKENFLGRIKSISAKRGVDKCAKDGRSDVPNQHIRLPRTGTSIPEITSEDPGASAPEGFFGNGKKGVDKSSISSKLCFKFHEFYIANRFHVGRKKPSRIVWTRACDSLLEQMEGDHARIRRVMDWFFEHHRDPYVPTAIEMTTFCQRFIDIEKAMRRDLGETKSSAPIQDLTSEEWERKFGEEAS